MQGGRGEGAHGGFCEEGRDAGGMQVEAAEARAAQLQTELSEPTRPSPPWAMSCCGYSGPPPPPPPPPRLSH